MFADMARFMSTMPDPAEIERRARECGLSIPRMCELAGTGNSTFYRWRAGVHSPNSRTMTRWLDTLEAAEKAAPPRPAA